MICLGSCCGLWLAILHIQFHPAVITITVETMNVVNQQVPVDVGMGQCGQILLTCHV